MTRSDRDETGTLARLALAQWLSPAFPVGGFAWSHGLEQAIADGRIRDAGALAAWVGGVLSRGAGLADAVLLVAAARPGADHAGLAGTARALAASRERLAETEAQGAAFTAAVNAAEGRADPPAPLPVAVGRAAARLGLPAAEVAALYLFAFAQALVLAGLRFVPLGQSDGQRVLADLRPCLLRLAAKAVSLDPDDITSCSVLADLAAMRHETLEPRMFRS